ncbi:MAG: nucleotidyltransferase substrate binding protein [bacterium]
MLDLSSLEKAIGSLKSAINVYSRNEKNIKIDPELRNAVRAGVVQNFEFTYELCWKFMKRWLDSNLGSMLVDGIHRRELFRLAAENQLISNVENWFEYYENRNKTSHTYNSATADEVVEAAFAFLQDAQELLVNLKKHND